MGPNNLSVEDRKERLEQLRVYEEFLSSERSIYEGWVSDLLEFWAGKEGQKEDTYYYLPELESALRRFVKKLPKSEIIDAMVVAFDRFPNTGPLDEYRMKYFFGTCWKKIKGEPAPCT